jgi:hypothetical protein
MDSLNVVCLTGALEHYPQARFANDGAQVITCTFATTHIVKME